MIRVDDELLAEAEAMARGHKPFRTIALLERLFDLPLCEHRKFAPREQLAVGYYAAAMRRRGMLTDRPHSRP